MPQIAPEPVELPNDECYAGYANLSMTDRKCWTIADIEALEASGNATEVDWFSEDS